ncbi:hypothetical protein TKK_0006014 [Trichogramma kaykai]
MAIQTTQAELAELSKQLDFEENQFYWLKKFLKFVFLCPVQPKVIQKSGRAMMHLSFIFSIIITCTRVHKELFVNEIYPPMMAEFAFQLITLSTKNETSDLICEAVTIDWLSIKDPEEKNTMKVVCEQGSRMVRIHFGFLLPSLLGFVLAPVALPYLLNPYLPENMTLERTLCAHVELFIDQDKYFHHILIFLIHMVILIMLVISAMDLIYTSCITYVMGKIIWIGYVFEKLLTSTMLVFFSHDDRCLQ